MGTKPVATLIRFLAALRDTANLEGNKLYRKVMALLLDIATSPSATEYRLICEQRTAFLQSHEHPNEEVIIFDILTKPFPRDKFEELAQTPGLSRFDHSKARRIVENRFFENVRERAVLLSLQQISVVHLLVCFSFSLIGSSRYRKSSA